MNWNRLRLQYNESIKKWGVDVAEFVKNLEDQRDVLEAIEKIKKLRMQRRFPDRNGMITALQDAKNKAPLEITALEFSQGDTHWMPFTDFPDTDLYRKLYQYEQGLEAYCIEKIGKQMYDKLMSDGTEV